MMAARRASVNLLAAKRKSFKTGGSIPGQENLESENPRFLKGNYLRIIEYFAKNLFYSTLNLSNIHTKISPPRWPH